MDKNYIINILKINECKICLEHVDNYKKYCNCSGTIKYLHKNCLIEYIQKNKNKIEIHKCYKYKIQCNICKSYISFTYKKSTSFYILIFTYLLFHIISSILYFIFLTKDLPKLLYILIYILTSSFYYSIFFFNIKKIKLYKSHICF